MSYDAFDAHAEGPSGGAQRRAEHVVDDGNSAAVHTGMNPLCATAQRV